MGIRLLFADLRASLHGFSFWLLCLGCGFVCVTFSVLMVVEIVSFIFYL